MTVYIGIDWSEAKHDIVFMNEAGAAIAQIQIPHSLEGFDSLDRTCRDMQLQTQDCMLGLETANNLIIDFLWARGYHQLYIVPPSMTRGNRSRFRSSGAKSDPTDALIIADSLRTDRGRLHLWKPDLALTQQIRSKVNLIHFLTRESVRTSNRLRTVLIRYYPMALNLFRTWPTQIGLHFIQHFPEPQDAANLTLEAFQGFAKAHHYPQSRIPACFARLQQDYPEAAPAIVLRFKDEAVLLATMLEQTMKAKNHEMRLLGKLFARHPDAPVFASLPGAGALLAPALLAKFGDDRSRFPAPANVQALAGTCPVTDRSGKRQVVKFRRACDREFRYYVQQWAIMSLNTSVWANAYYTAVFHRCRSKSQAYRCLGNRWLAIAWKLWQTGECYDEAYHLNQRRIHSKPLAN